MPIEMKQVWWDRDCRKNEDSFGPLTFTPTRRPPYANSEERAPLVKGDHHKDLAYDCEFIELREFFDNGTYGVNAYMPRKSLCPSQEDKMRWYTGSEKIRSMLLAGHGLTGQWPKLELPHADPDLIRELREVAQTQALSKARSAAMNIPMLIKERQETLQLIRDKTIGIAQKATAKGRADVRRYFQTDKRSRRRLHRQIANEHLAFLFGILPLIEEVEGLMEIVNDEVPDIIFTGRGQRAYVTTEAATPLQFRSGNNRVLSFEVRPRVKERTSVRVSLKYKVTAKGLSKLQKAYGFNPAASVYDFVPLSFVSDFVSNTGNFLRSYDPIIGAEFSTGCWTLYRSTQIEAHAFPNKSDLTEAYGIVYDGMRADGKLNVERVRIVRNVYSGEPEPFWYFLPDNMSLGKAATLASLAVQRYLKPLQRVIAAKPFRYRGPRPKYLPPVKYKR